MFYEFSLLHSSLSVRCSTLVKMPYFVARILYFFYKSKMRLVFQRELVLCGGVSRQLFKRFVKSASMCEKATQRQGINGMRIQIA